MRNFFSRLAYSYARFMSGRYGTDQLNMVLLVASIIVEIIYSFTGMPLLLLLSTALLGWAVFRMFSKNTMKRYNENKKFLGLIKEIKMLPHYHIYKCPSCGQKIRIPRKGGKKVEIRCPKCGMTFVKTI